MPHIYIGSRFKFGVLVDCFEMYLVPWRWFRSGSGVVRETFEIVSGAGSGMICEWF